MSGWCFESLKKVSGEIKDTGCLRIKNNSSCHVRSGAIILESVRSGLVKTG